MTSLLLVMAARLFILVNVAYFVLMRHKDVFSKWAARLYGRDHLKCDGTRRMEWVASTLHTTSEFIVSSITIADAHTSGIRSVLNKTLLPI
jgi:hypothetical protein